MSSLTIHNNNRDGKNQPRQSLPVSISPVNDMLPTTTNKPETMLEIRDVSVSVFNRILRFPRHDVLCGGSDHSRSRAYDQAQLSLPSPVLLHLQGGREGRHQPGLRYILLTGRRKEGAERRADAYFV